MGQTVKTISTAAGDKVETAFGYQLLLDLYGCRDGVCDDLALCYRFLDECVEVLGMEKQSPPAIFRSDAKRFPDKAGLSGWVPLIESSIVIHTLSVKKFISLDVYCCRPFDPLVAENLSRAYFSPQAVESQFLRRGARYHDEPPIHTASMAA